MNKQDERIGTADAARMLGIGLDRLYRLIRSGKIRSTVVEGRHYVTRADLKRRIKSLAESAPKSSERVRS